MTIRIDLRRIKAFLSDVPDSINPIELKNVSVTARITVIDRKRNRPVKFEILSIYNQMNRGMAEEIATVIKWLIIIDI